MPHSKPVAWRGIDIAQGDSAGRWVYSDTQSSACPNALYSQATVDALERRIARLEGACRLVRLADLKAMEGIKEGEDDE